jgi:glycosyltransferase involved in cell wall biosynthesis
LGENSRQVSENIFKYATNNLKKEKKYLVERIRMKNILFIHSSSELYGSDRSLLNIVKNIDKTQYKIFVILPCFGPLVDEMKKIPGVSVEIFEVAILRRKNLSIIGAMKYIREFYVSYRYLKNYIRKNSISIVDTNTAVVFPGAIAAKHSNVKSVWHIREIIKNNFENRVISLVMNRYAHLIVANSKETGKALYVDQSKVRAIYNAVEEKENMAEIPHSQLTVGMAGRINRWKGQKLFIDAAEIVHRVMPEVIFKVAGDAYKGEEQIRDEIIHYILKKHLENTVILLGQVNDMSDFYRNIDLFVLPSIQPEPFGLVVIEAMEYGLPVIATNHGGPTEIISNGIDGYLVDYQNAEQMANKIIELMSDKERRKRMGLKGKEKKRNCFSISEMVRGIENVFEEVLK